MASIVDTLAISLRPDLAMMLAMGAIKVQLSNINLDYKGKLLVHACKYQDFSAEKEGYRRLVEYGWTPEMAPERSILGWAEIAEVKLYNPNTFMLDAPLHWYGDNYYQFQAQQGWIGQDVYGYVLESQHLLKLPIMGVGDDQARHGVFWSPKTPFEVMCFKMALDKERDSIDIEAVDSSIGG